MLVHDITKVNQLIVDNLSKIRKLKFDYIVHLPRSGTIPASILATYMNKPLASVDEWCNRITWNRGSAPVSPRVNPIILLVDDSIRTGKQMRDNVAKIQKLRPETKILSLAIFSTQYSPRLYDVTLTLRDDTRDDYIYPWFLWKSRRITNVAFDMDGVLCEDCTKENDDDGPLYQNFLKTVPLKFHSKHTLGAIVTGRLEKYRPETEEWLTRQGFSYKQLIMGPWKTKVARKAANPAFWKANVFSNLDLTLYVESSIKEAEIISQNTAKTVYCIENSKTYNNGYLQPSPIVL